MLHRTASLADAAKKIRNLAKDEAYRRRIVDGERAVLGLGSHADSAGYHLVLEDETRVPVPCPACYEGALVLRAFRCENTANPEDVVYLSLLRCTDAACLFISDESPEAIANKLTVKGQLASEKKREAQLGRSRRLDELQELVDASTWSNVLKAVLIKLRRPLLVAATVVAVVTVALIVAAISGVRFTSISTKLPGGGSVQITGGTR